MNGGKTYFVAAVFHDAKMLLLPQTRKPFLKEGLIPTILRKWDGTEKKSRKCGSQGKTGRKIRRIRHVEKWPESRRSGWEYNRAK
ncbi:hypothetical protein NBH21_17315 [Rhizobium sp. S101]|uniref:Uncharacterized protein n=1 Tax=Ciceribacter sichuanensis TaxID=2949647 RepID=A0AAJ1BYD2_9HYPH|nr:hypothetical protein [Ciceribacter sp. S101]